MITIKKIVFNKRVLYLISLIIFILFTLVFNIAFSAFTNETIKEAANIKVNDMKYVMTLNGNSGNIINVSAKKTLGIDVIITSLNKIDSKYELIYKVCSDATCTSTIQKPESLLIEYSSKTTDAITGLITAKGSKNIRIAITNNLETDVYIELGINAGYTHNTLEILGLITTEYNEEDVTIASIINGNLTTTFPTTPNYETEVECKVDNQETTATGTATWDGTKWVVDIINATTGRTYCNVYFNLPLLRDKIFEQYGGTNAISAIPQSLFSFTETGAGGMFKAEDDYGISYYFRGNHNLPNNVIFAGFQWKIIRITGAGSIKLIYNGICPENNCTINNSTAGSSASLNAESAFNTATGDNRFIGYMYGGIATTYALTHENVLSSTIKKAVDAFYSALSADAKSKIVDTIYCADRQSSTAYNVLNGGGGYSGMQTYYSRYISLVSNKQPSLKCTNTNDQFTLTKSNRGNRSLSNPIGLINVDEVSYAGAVWGVENNDYYLRINQNFLTMTPYWFYFGNGGVFRVSDTGSISSTNSNSLNGVRPVIALNPDVGISGGNGSLSSPYIIE